MRRSIKLVIQAKREQGVSLVTEWTNQHIGNDFGQSFTQLVQFAVKSNYITDKLAESALEEMIQYIDSAVGKQAERYKNIISKEDNLGIIKVYMR